MGLEQCKECGEEVSTDASECPNCGVDHPTGKGCLQEFSTLLCALFLLGGIGSLCMGLVPIALILFVLAALAYLGSR